MRRAYIDVTLEVIEHALGLPQDIQIRLIDTDRMHHSARMVRLFLDGVGLPDSCVVPEGAMAVRLIRYTDGTLDEHAR